MYSIIHLMLCVYYIAMGYYNNKYFAMAMQRKRDNPRDTPKKTTFHSTIMHLQQSEAHGSVGLQQILELYAQGQTPGALNYVRTLMKTKGALHRAVKQDILDIIRQKPDENPERNTWYKQLRASRMLGHADFILLLKEVAVEQPSNVFSAIHDQGSALAQILRLQGVDMQDAVSAVAESMLLQNKHRVLEYIAEIGYSNTLKHLSKDVGGMQSFINLVSETLTESIRTDEDVKRTVHRTITLYFDLARIDFTLVLLTPVFSYLGPVLAAAFRRHGTEASARAIFGSMTERIDEISDNSQALFASLLPHNPHCGENGGVLDFLLSLVPYEDMLGTLSECIARDMVLNRTLKEVLLDVLVAKIGAQRMIGVHIIMNDFLRFGDMQVSREAVISDSVSALLGDTVAVSKDVSVFYFTFSSHSWPEHNLADIDEVFSLVEHTPKDLPPGAKMEELLQQRSLIAPGARRRAPSLSGLPISIEYIDAHTYVEVLVSEGGETMRLVIPVLFLIHREDCARGGPGHPPGWAEKNGLVTEKEKAMIRRFWVEVRRRLAAKAQETEGAVYKQESRL